MNLGETIYRLRTERNLSQGDLADALDVSRQSVSKWENNSAVPELEKLIKMAQIFGITLDALVSGEVKTTTPPPPIASTNPIPGRRLVVPGIILLCFGILMALISLPLVWPFLVCGVLCLTLKQRHGLWCCWVVYFFLSLWLYYSTTFSMDPFWVYLKTLIVHGTARTHPATLLVAIANNAVTILMTVWTLRSYRNVASHRNYNLRFLIVGWALTFLPDILRQVSAALIALTMTTSLIFGSTGWSIVHFLLQWAQIAITVIMLFHTTRALGDQCKF